MMIRVADLVTVAKAYAGIRKLSLSRVSTLVFNDGKRLRALENGAEIGVNRFNEGMSWFARQWPAGQPWPSGVERPS